MQAIDSSRSLHSPVSAPSETDGYQENAHSTFKICSCLNALLITCAIRRIDGREHIHMELQSVGNRPAPLVNSGGWAVQATLQLQISQEKDLPTQQNAEIGAYVKFESYVILEQLKRINSTDWSAFQSSQRAR